MMGVRKDRQTIRWMDGLNGWMNEWTEGRNKGTKVTQLSLGTC